MTRPMEIKSGVSRRLYTLFVIAVAVMGVHKLESWWTFEWEVSPFFAFVASHMGSVEEGMFYAFIVWLFVGLGCAAGVMAGARIQQGLFAVYGLTFLEEFHHVIRTVEGGAYYPGVLSALVYIPLGVLYWRELIACVRNIPGGLGQRSAHQASNAAMWGHSGHRLAASENASTHSAY